MRNLSAKQPTEAQLEAEIQRAIRLELGNPDRYPDVWLGRNNNGVLEDKNGQKVRYGLGNGTGDLVGMFTPTEGPAIWIEAEIKTPDGRQSDEQKMREQLVANRRGTYVVLRSVEDAREWIARLRAGAE